MVKRARPRVWSGDSSRLTSVSAKAKPSSACASSRQPARFVQGQLRGAGAELEVGGLRQLSLGEHLVSVEGQVVQDGARAELDRNAEHGFRLAAHGTEGVGSTRKVRIGIRLAQGHANFVVATSGRRPQARTDGATYARRRARIATAAQQLRGAHRRREVTLGAVQILDVLHGPLVDVGHVGLPGVGLIGLYPGAGGAVGTEGLIHGLGIHRAQDVAPGQLFRQEAVDLAAYLARRARAREARILAGGDAHRLPLANAEHEIHHRSGQSSTQLRADLRVQEPALGVEVPQPLYQGGRSAIVRLFQVQGGFQLGGVEQPIALELQPHEGPHVRDDLQHTSRHHTVRHLRAVPATLLQHLDQIAVRRVDGIFVQSVARAHTVARQHVREAGHGGAGPHGELQLTYPAGLAGANVHGQHDAQRVVGVRGVHADLHLRIASETVQAFHASRDVRQHRRGHFAAFADLRGA